MGKTFESIDADLAAWIQSQHLFFTATAPDARDGLVNCSPKGLDSFRILGPTRVAYLDLTGSGVETIAHLQQNGRIVILFCAFDGRPRIVRIHGTGRVVRPGDRDWDDLRSGFADIAPGAERAIIVVDASRISDSCGFGVPHYAYTGERDQLPKWAAAKGPDGAAAYQAKNNATSLDGLPGLAGAGAD